MMHHAPRTTVWVVHDNKQVREPMMRLLSFGWGLGGVVLLLGYAIVRLLPLVTEALDDSLTWPQWAVFGGNTLLMAYYEGYRGFQKGFSPRVAARAKYLYNHPQVWPALLAPLFCLGYFQTTRQRKIITYALTVMIVGFILIIHQLPQPWRGLVDAGVVVGLSWGVLSLLYYGVQAFTSAVFDYSPEVDDESFVRAS